MTYETPLSRETRTVVSPSSVVVGAGAVEQVGEYAARHGTTALLVATEQIFEFHGDKVIDALDTAGVESVSYTDVRPDPTVENIESAYELWKRHDCDVLVTLGGGSSIDTGKGVGILASNDGEIRDFGVDRAGYEGVPEPTPPLIAVNTTAGTGSEATRSVVVSDESTSTKFLIVSENVVPDIAIEDPELTVSLPRSHTAFTGIDALTHAIEAYVSVNAYDIPDSSAEEAMERIARSLPVAWANGDDLDARADMLVGQLQAGQAFTNSSVALVHGLARPLGAQLHVPHGLANALILPYVAEFSAMAAPEKYATVARILGAADESDTTREAADKAAEGILRLCDDLDLTGYLDDFGEVPSRERYLSVVDEMTQDAIDSGSPANNPRKPTSDEIRDLYIDIYDDALAPDSPRRS
ncbi:iron-containing alcohol dehydrogenase [Haloarcula japonica]|uniref:Iron-containing alcohol dehydrogenase n=1 Tax=Haloarcula japonica (strain ATCC 49778 / DSM 6131 / JCM 7785 / NBRC 101032 / NCIMB 13157 / TR-1) TaxID=1227453 RepID=M0L0B2_HALJT|nr:iron-containing alcohol dehydrogenase [Haloarcula japonica]EMA26986.1 iron-containing alcohol dehydrogenase [Haloarcula japonica DSM 6131]